MGRVSAGLPLEPGACRALGKSPWKNPRQRNKAGSVLRAAPFRDGSRNRAGVVRDEAGMGAWDPKLGDLEPRGNSGRAGAQLRLSCCFSYLTLDFGDLFAVSEPSLPTGLGEIPEATAED